MNTRFHLLLASTVLLGPGLIHAQGETKIAQPLPPTMDAKPAPVAYEKTAAPRWTASAANQLGKPDPAASEPLTNVQPSLRVPSEARTSLHYDVDASGAVWARGGDYKARFGAGSATFLPFLGSRAAHSFALEMRLESVSSGGTPIAFDANATAQRIGDEVVLERGSLREVYDLALNSVEQSFVFESLPTQGDLVVRIGIETELSGRVDGDGLRFENELGSVNCGRVAVVDARGQRAQLAAELVDGAIEITAPASFLSGATFPVTIDPLISTFAVDTSSAEDFAADAAYDVASGDWWVVYEEVFSSTDHDMYAGLFDGSNGAFLGYTTIDVSVDSYSHPKVANNRLASQFLVVAAVGASGSREIRGRTFEPAGHVLSTVIEISGTEVGDKFNPDVGGDPSLSYPTYYCVVWERTYSASDHDIHARLVRPDDTLLGTGTIFLENSAGTIDSVPSVSKSDGLDPYATQNWNVVWQHEFSSTDDDIQGARIHWDGTITTPTFLIASSPANERSPHVSSPMDDNGVGRPYLVVFTETQPAGDTDIIGYAFHGTTLVAGQNLTQDIGDDVTDNQFAPEVDYDGSSFTVVHTRASGLFPYYSYQSYVSSVYLSGGALGIREGDVQLVASSDDIRRPAIVSLHGAGVTTGARSILAYDRSSASNLDNVYTAVYDAPFGGPISRFCFGTAAACPCGNGGGVGHGCANSVNPQGAQLLSGGFAKVSLDSLVLTGIGMPATATCLYFQGTTQVNGGSGSAFGDGLRCAGGTVIRLGTKVNVNGSSSYPNLGDAPISLHGLVPAAGAQRTYQVWYRNSAAFCTSATYNLSNGLNVTWVP